MLGNQRGQHRQQETFGFPRSGSARDHHVTARGGLADRLLLVEIQRAVQRKGRAAQPGERRVEHPVGDQVAQAGPGPVRRGRLEDRPLGQQRAVSDASGQSSGKCGIPDGQQ